MSKFDSNEIESHLRVQVYENSRLDDASSEWGTSWYYTYGLYPGQTLDWAVKNRQEFTPMLWGATVKFPNGYKCSLTREGTLDDPETEKD